MSQNGKGSKRRVSLVSQDTWDKNYERIFRKKTLFIPCSCKSEILVIEYDHEIELADLAIFEHYTNYSNKMSLWQRLRYCFQVLAYKKPYADQMVLDKKQLKDLQKFLNGLNL